MFQHQYVSGDAIDLPVGKVVCVGRNYVEHVKELNNEMPTEPLLFIKPSTAVVTLEDAFSIPQNRGAVHHEVEIAILIGQKVSSISEASAWQFVRGVGIALDLTLRDVQSRLKEKGHPWEQAKAFDGACPLSRWLPVSEISNRDNIEIQLMRNGVLQQKGASQQMITAIPTLMAYISQYFTLEPGDIVLTGTPAGVGPLESGDTLVAELNNQYQVETSVI